jgi:lysophospholipase L1-like esterase
MFSAIVTHEDIIQQEGVLDSYLREELDWLPKIENAKKFVRQELKNNAKQLKKICVPLYFKDSAGLTTLTETSVTTDEDIIERLRLVVNVSSLTGNVIFTLYGTNDTVFEQVKGLSPDGTVLNNLLFTTNGTDTFIIQKAFKYYYLDVSGTSTFEAYLVETTFEQPVLFKALEYIYKDLQGEPNSNFEAKSEFYAGLFNDSFQTALYSYDSDLSGTVEETEQNYNQVIRYLR